MAPRTWTLEPFSLGPFEAVDELTLARAGREEIRAAYARATRDSLPRFPGQSTCDTEDRAREIAAEQYRKMRLEGVDPLPDFEALFEDVLSRLTFDDADCRPDLPSAFLGLRLPGSGSFEAAFLLYNVVELPERQEVVGRARRTVLPITAHPAPGVSFEGRSVDQLAAVVGVAMADFLDGLFELSDGRLLDLEEWTFPTDRDGTAWPPAFVGPGSALSNAIEGRGHVVEREGRRGRELLKRVRRV